MSQNNPIPDFAPEETEFLRQLRPGSHPPPDLLRAAAEDALPEDLKTQIRKHVRSCEVCSVLQDDLLHLEPTEPSEEQRRRIRDKLPVSRRSGGKLRRWGPWPKLLIAGAVALLIMIVVVVEWRPHPAPAPRRAAETPAVPHRAELPVAKAPIEIAAALLPTRGAQRPDLPGLQEWTLALKPYQADDFGRAVSELTLITRRYPRFADGYFYLGVSQLMIERNEDAAQGLKKAAQLASGTRLLEVKWYLGLAQARLGHRAEAVQNWHAVCAAGSVDAKEACAALSRAKSSALP